MNAEARVSVIVPAFDADPFLAQALRSIFLQGEVIGEVLVVDDGSTRSVAPTLRALGTRVQLLVQANLGPAAARNAGLARVRSQYIAFLDADDTWMPGAIAAAVMRLEARAELDGVHGLTQLMLHDSKHTEADDTRVGAPWRSPQLGSLVLRAETLARVGGFDPALRSGEDLDWIVRARDSGARFELLDRVLLFYRIHERNLTRNMNAVERNTLHVLKRALDRRRAASKGGQPC
jgi:glycosyltransferase involved in cell wall biosynthesis